MVNVITNMVIAMNQIKSNENNIEINSTRDSFMLCLIRVSYILCRFYIHSLFNLNKCVVNSYLNVYMYFIFTSSSSSFYCNQFIFVIILNRQSVIRHIRHDIYQLMYDTNAAPYITNTIIFKHCLSTRTMM